MFVSDSTLSLFEAGVKWRLILVLLFSLTEQSQIFLTFFPRGNPLKTEYQMLDCSPGHLRSGEQSFCGYPYPLKPEAKAEAKFFLPSQSRQRNSTNRHGLAHAVSGLSPWNEVSIRSSNHPFISIRSKKIRTPKMIIIRMTIHNHS